MTETDTKYFIVNVIEWASDFQTFPMRSKVFSSQEKAEQYIMKYGFAENHGEYNMFRADIVETQIDSQEW